MIEWASLTRERPLVRFPDLHALRRQFNVILGRLGRGYTDHTLLELSRFLVTVMALLHAESGEAADAARRDRLEAAMGRMRETLRGPLGVADYARVAGLSVSQFSHLFRRYYGTSPMAYLNELRMQRARELLDLTGRSVKEVAGEVGFEDPLYFSRAFKAITGQSPSAYRTTQKG